MYKAPGLFIRITYANETFTATDVAGAAYTPVIYVNADWRNGSGDSYQPENRLSSDKTVWFNAGTDEGSTTFSGDGATTNFSLSSITDFHMVTDVQVNGASTAAWYVEGTDLVFYTAPEEGTDNISVYYTVAVKTYHLPVGNITSVVSVIVDDAVVPSTGYTVDTTNGVVTFASAPPVTNPRTNNSVRITYTKANPDALASIMDCPYAIVYGGNQNICIVVGGCKAQPNAFFWNGNNVAMDESYWPMEQYNLGGDTEEEITGFGKQQGYLIVFKNHSIGKGEMTFSTVDLGSGTTKRQYIEIDYTAINAKTGCDLPWTIQLIENNLVFCNRQQGIHIIKDSSAAYENNVVGISRKVNGTPSRAGVLTKLRRFANPDDIVSFDDDERYWLVINNEVYVWDYIVSEPNDPSFFYYTNIRARAFVKDDAARIYHIDGLGRLTELVTNLFSDYGEAIHKLYTFPAQFFNTYDRLKDVTRSIFSVKPNTSTSVKITYLTDWGQRSDLTDIKSLVWSLRSRDLSERNLASSRFSTVAIRKPGCRHVRHFQMSIENDEVGRDMGVVFAQIFYKFQGRDR